MLSSINSGENQMPNCSRCLLILTCANCHAGPAITRNKRCIDKLANETLTKTGVPSASIAVVKDGQVVYVKAYGDARIDPKTPATPEMRYSIGSISKQFTATAILLLQEQGKLSLDDKVAKFIPDLTRANEVTIRQLLSHTSGYQDYWPQDYVMPMMLEPSKRKKFLISGHVKLWTSIQERSGNTAIRITSSRIDC
jgi:CubicO group peptidase (beta-lactamase class C family)